MTPTATVEGPVEVDPRIAARRHAVVADQRRRRRRRLAGVAIALTVVAALYGLSRTALFDVEEVRVEGAAHTSVDDVRAATGIEPGHALLDVDTGAAADAVASLPWIATAEVERGLDGLVVVQVTERTAVVRLPDAHGGWAAADREGRVLERLPADPATWDPGLLAVDGLVAPDPGQSLGPEADAALEVAGLLTPGLRARVAHVGVRPDGSLGLQLVPEGIAELGAPLELEAKLAALTTTLAQVDQCGLAEVDLRVPDLVTVSRTC